VKLRKNMDGYKWDAAMTLICEHGANQVLLSHNINEIAKRNCVSRQFEPKTGG